MSFKLAIVLVIGLVCGGFALPRSEVESSLYETFANVAISSLLKDSQPDLSLVQGISNCVTLGVQILSQYKTKVLLSVNAFTARIALAGGTSKCFIRKSAFDVHYCGVEQFNNYKAIAEVIAKDQAEVDKVINGLKENFRNCLKEKPTASPPTENSPVSLLETKPYWL